MQWLGAAEPKVLRRRHSKNCWVGCVVGMKARLAKFNSEANPPLS